MARDRRKIATLTVWSAGILLCVLFGALALNWRTEIWDATPGKRCSITLTYLQTEVEYYRFQHGNDPSNLTLCVVDDKHLKCPSTRMPYGYIVSADGLYYCIFDSAPHNEGFYAITQEGKVHRVNVLKLFEITNAVAVFHGGATK